MTDARVAQPIEILHGHGTALACDRQGRLNAHEQHGLFVADTRVLSTYRTSIGGQAWQPLGRRRHDNATVSWQFQNPLLRDASGDVPEGTLLLDIRRRIAGAMHEDLTIRAFPGRTIRTVLTIQIDADFADIFEVKSRSVPARPRVGRDIERDAVALVYQRGGFRRGCRIRFTAGSSPRFSGALATFDLVLEHGCEWHCCLELEPEVDGRTVTFAGDPHGDPSPTVERSPVRVIAVPLVRGAFDRGRDDIASLALPQNGSEPLVAAGAPWFLALFGRDSLVTALMTGSLGAWVAEGALDAVGMHQSEEPDDRRDAEPGKLPHELRRGELARFGLIPHTPYYGTHDAPALFCLTLWNAWRWTGDDALLERHLDVARRALRWCDDLGDRDGDGLLEYGTRSRDGYVNQGWKDAGDAIAHEDGALARPPIATVELQGYLFAARLAMAELLDRTGETSAAADLTARAAELRELVEDRFWLEDIGSYALALDGDKRQVRSVASNAAHLLWTGLPHPDRARRVAARMLRRDMFTGWGLRTLSADHLAYNPLSYQRGSVWPHDTAIAAAGMARYGLHDEAETLNGAVFDAAAAFEDDRLPELFCGFDRSDEGPIPYREANAPQAWAASAAILSVQTMLGLVPDAPNGRCVLRPRLPERVPRLDVRGIRVGNGTFDVETERSGARTDVVRIAAERVNVVQGSPTAPLWGSPPP